MAWIRELDHETHNSTWPSLANDGSGKLGALGDESQDPIPSGSLAAPVRRRERLNPSETSTTNALDLEERDVTVSREDYLLSGEVRELRDIWDPPKTKTQRTDQQLLTVCLAFLLALLMSAGGW